MEQPQSFSQKQREMLARLLEQARKSEEAQLESDRDVDDQVQAELVPKLAKERGALDLVAKVRNLRSQVEEAEEALEHLGFRCDEDSISLRYNAPKDLRAALEIAKRVARNERRAVLKRYDLAILGVWAAEDAQTAKKMVEEIL